MDFKHISNIPIEAHERNVDSGCLDWLKEAKYTRLAHSIKNMITRDLEINDPKYLNTTLPKQLFSALSY